MLALTFHYLAFVVRQYEDMAYEAIKLHRIETTSIFASNIDKLVVSGFTWDDNRDLYDTMIHWYVDTMGIDDFTYITIVSPYIDPASNGFAIRKLYGVGSFDLFESEDNIQIVMEAISESNAGFIDVVIGGATRRLYFQAIPLDNTEYWIFVGVNREILLETFDFSILQIPIFIVGLFFTISIMDSVWQRILKIRRK